MRIVSFLPAGTEIVCALGLEGSLVGRSAECDFPASTGAVPVVVRPRLATEGAAAAEIDRLVAAQAGAGGAFYEVDELRLREAAPDLILTQDLCQVCAPSGNEVTAAIAALPRRPRVESLQARTLADIQASFRAVGAGDVAALDRRWAAALAAIQARLTGRPVVHVCLLEWADPPFATGHWIPEMVALAGGREVIGKAGEHSRRMPWEEVVAAAPEALIVAPCGFGLSDAILAAESLRSLPGWCDLPAVAAGRVFAVDANAYITRPGPRVVEGIATLAEILHPEPCRGLAPPDAYARIAG